jgi:hypothetical protein
MATNPGIDYGRGLTNIDTETGIRYGVISQNEVLQAWADSSEAIYPWTCGYCGNDLTSEPWEYPAHCDHCNRELTEDDFDMQEPAGFEYNQDGYICHQSADDTDIFVIKSPYYTYAQFCSPCAPGAGYLMNPFRFNVFDGYGENKPLLSFPHTSKTYKQAAENAGYPKVYCFDASWFDDNKAPYPVFSVETGEIVNP